MTALPTTEHLVLEKKGSVLTVWLNRPAAKNSLSVDMIDELHGVLDAAATDTALRTLIIRGKGDIFCAGADIKGFRAGPQGGEQDAAHATESSLLTAAHGLPAQEPPAPGGVEPHTQESHESEVAA